LYGWDNDKIKTNAKETFNALLSKSLSDDPLGCSIPPELDLVWHEMILNTEKYQLFCKKVFNEFLHHTTETMNDELEVKQARVDRTLAICKSVIDPRTEWKMETKHEIKHEGERKRVRETSVLPELNQVFVKVLNGKTETVWISPNMSVGDMCHVLSFKTNVPSYKIRLIFAGRNLERNKSMGDYSIRKESTIHMTLTICGC